MSISHIIALAVYGLAMLLFGMGVGRKNPKIADSAAAVESKAQSVVAAAELQLKK